MNRIAHIWIVIVAVITIISSPISAQQTTDQMQEDISTLLKEGRFKKAVDKLDELVLQAREATDAPTEVLAIWQRADLIRQHDERRDLAAIDRLMQDAEASESDEVKSMTYLALADHLHRRHQQFAYQLRDRTYSPDTRREAVETWDLQTLREAKRDAIIAFLGRVGVLVDRPLGAYKALIKEAEKTGHLYPNVYDLAVHHALGLLDGARDLVSEDLYPFEDWMTIVERPARDEKWTDERLVDVLYRRLLEAQSDYDDKNPLLYTLYTRLEPLQAKSQGRIQRQQDYEELVEEYIHRFGQYKEVTTMVYLLGQSRLVNLLGQKSFEDRRAAAPKIADVMEMWEAHMKKYDKAYGTDLIRNRYESIRQANLSVSSEGYVAPDMPIFIKIDHKRLASATLGLVKISLEEYYDFTQGRGDRKKKAAQLTKSNGYTYQRTIDLPHHEDYVNYSSEFLLEGVPAGIYLIVLASQDGFRGDAVNTLFVTDMMASQEQVNGQHRVILMNRTTGQPMQGVEVDVYRLDYRRDVTKTQIHSTTTSQDGVSDIKVPARAGRTLIEMRYQDQVLVSGRGYFGGWRGGRNQDRDAAVFYTDRAIYRPGQTIYYSALVYNQKAEGYPEPSTLNKVTVRLTDMNGQEVGTQSLEVDDYGGIFGEFQLPDAGLNGYYTLQADQLGSQSVRVEAYKRPTFKVEVDPIQGDIAFDQPLTVEGKATTFAGPAVQNGKVTYRIQRYVYRPYWCGMYYDFYAPPWLANDELVASGEVITDEMGLFQIPFTPESMSDGSRLISLRYLVTVEVLDEKGETQSTQSNFYVSNQPQFISSNLSAQMSVDELDSLILKVQNVMQQPSRKSLTWQLELLKRPEVQTMDRLWPAPDYPISADEALAERRAYLPSASAIGYDTWEVEELWALASGEVTGERSWSLPELPSAGVYRLSIYDDNDSLIRKEYAEVFSFDEMVLPTKSILATITDKPNYAPGEKARVLIGQAYTQTPIWVQVIRQSGTEEAYWWTPSDDNRVLEVSVNEADHGGLSLHLMSTWLGRMMSERVHIQVPWTHKQLDVQLMTVRDETQPGGDESWKVRVLDAQGSPARARLVAAMYDLSLDQFVAHPWFKVRPNGWYPDVAFTGIGDGITSLRLNWDYIRGGSISLPPQFKYIGSVGMRYRSAHMRGAMHEEALMTARPPSAPGAILELDAEESYADAAGNGVNALSAKVGGAEIEGDGLPPETEQGAPPENFSPRENLAETVFFYPELESDEEGYVTLDFKMNEALTTWRLQLMAWDSELAMGYKTHDVVTKKDLMVFPQLPRFMRQGDKLRLTARVNKLVDKSMDITASIELIDAITGDTITDSWIKEPILSLGRLDQDATQAVWDVVVPEDADHPIQVIVKAWSDQHVDGEVHELPVLTTKNLITETLPMYAHGGQSKTYTFDALSGFDEKGRQPVALTVSYMDNPAWLAVQSLPYLANYSHDCSEQIAHRIFANAIASHILDQMPEVERMIKDWKRSGQLTSPLKDNQELKNIVLEYTPWLRDAIQEEDGMAAISQLFDRTRSENALRADVRKLIQRQQGDGGFVWFGGYRSDRRTTQLVLEIFGRLNRLGIQLPDEVSLGDAMQRALDFVHEEIQEDHSRFSATDKKGVSNLDLHALYVYTMYDVRRDWQSKAWSHIIEHGQEDWLKRNLYIQAMMVVGYHRWNSEDTFPAKVMASLQDRAHQSEELGMHWMYHNGYQWHSRPIEAQSMMIEAFHELKAENDVLDAMRLWLLKHKQTNRWESTVATGRAVYALLMQGTNWLGDTKPVVVKMGGEVLTFADAVPGTGYRKMRIDGAEISSGMADISLDNANEVTSWGSVYYQYLQDVDQVEAHGTEGMTMKRDLMVKRVSGAEERLEHLNDAQLSVGDRLTVRLTFTVDRLMSYLHIEDMRPSGVSPVKQLSRYVWQDGIGYYQTSSDVATHYFIDHAQPGTYVLEYDTWVNLDGDYNAGLATIQCMYAPEFAAQSSGSRLSVGAE